MKKIYTLTAIATVSFMIGMGAEFAREKMTSKVTVKNTYTETNEEKGIYLNENETYIELSDGSWILCDEVNQKFIFQPVDLGDWDVPCKTKQQLENCVKTYISMKNTGSF